MKDKNSIVFFFWEGYISISPSIINLANSFGEKGHSVFILIPSNIERYSPDCDMHKNVTVYSLAYNNMLDAFLKKIDKIPKLRGLVRIFLKDRLILSSLISESRKFLRKLNENFDCVGVDPIGLYWAAKIKNDSSKLFYLSLELLCKDTIRSYRHYFLHWIKRKEILVHHQLVSTVFIQDQYRLSILLKENKIKSGCNYHLLTNSPRIRRGQSLTKKDYFEKIFSLSSENVKVLMAGMIHEFVFATKLSETFKAFTNRNIVLIFHERQKRESSEPYLKNLKKLGGENFYLSLNPVAYSDIELVYRSADIGLVFYDPRYGDNFESIVGASGKLSHCLMYGLPVIANNLPGFSNLFLKYKCGIIINGLDELEIAIQNILADYHSYSSNAYQCYVQEYDFDVQFESLYKSCFN